MFVAVIQQPFLIQDTMLVWEMELLALPFLENQPELTQLATLLLLQRRHSWRYQQLSKDSRLITIDALCASDEYFCSILW